MEPVKQSIEKAIKKVFNESVDVVLTRPDEQFGDFATNVALQLAKKVGKNPREVAEAIIKELPKDVSAEVAGPGFINLTLSDEALFRLTEQKPKQSLKGKTVVAEYSDPNPFKVLHAGHLYTSIVGDAIANLLEVAGGKVHRVNFGGDVGLHVGKTMWAILNDLGEEPLKKIKKLESESTVETRNEWMAQCYVKGNNAYDENPAAKQKAIELNKKVYQVHEQNDRTSEFAQIYWACRDWSYEYFKKFYEDIGSGFKKFYPESEVAAPGLKIVKEHIQKGMFEESDGAVIFRGEPYGLHTRVFINKEGLPTYEAKDVGLIFAKKKDYNFDKSVVITGNEQEQYMAVVLKAVEQFEPKLVAATKHLTHGMVKLKGGIKMSSRKGNILQAVYVLDVAEEAAQKISDKNDWRVVLGAVKYAFLKQRTGGDIIYDPEESVSVHGNSGPYLQYAYSRANSIIKKSINKPPDRMYDYKLNPEERSLVRKIGEYTEVVERSTNELAPHHICTYLYELAQSFNRMYEKHKVIGSDYEIARIGLVGLYAHTLKEGLAILNITAPDKM